MAYVKNVFDHDSITGAFLNSDDTGLTTNVFLNEPRLYGLRVTKEWTGQGWWTGANPNHTGPYPLTVEIGGQVQRQDAPYSAIVPSFAGAFSDTLDLLPAAQNRRLDRGDGREIKVAYRGAGSPWSLAGEYRYGKTNSRETRLHAQEAAGAKHCGFFVGYQGCYSGYNPSLIYKYATNFSDSTARNSEEHEIVEFEVGRDVKLGAAVDTRVAVGLRGAHLTSETSVTLAGVPDWQLVDSWLFVRSSHTRDQADLTTRRKFEGAGPVLSVEGTLPIIESKEAGVVGISAAVTGGVLFGKQNTSADGFEQIGVYNDKYQNLPQTPVAPPTRTPVNAHRSSSATVPVLDASLGLSYEIQRIKLSTGYRWERYFNVLDGGYQEHKSYDRTIDGPYFKIAVGFGG
ncbi:MAG: Lpg1974 family pore-forming outer membrane protein [Parcubacteria group bacterium]